VGKRSRDKGANAERAAARILQLLYPDAARRCSGEESQDAIRGRDLKGTPGLCVQVKETGAPQPLAALEEAIRAAGSSGDIPVAIVRQSRMGSSTPFRVILRMQDFLAIMWLASKPPFEERAGAAFRSAVCLEKLAEGDAQMRARIG
jgi:hypothetical protein